MKIHAIKSLHSPKNFGDIPEIVEEIIYILETLSMNHLPPEVKTFVKICDIMAHQYNQRVSMEQPSPLSMISSMTFMAAQICTTGELANNNLNLGMKQ